MSDKSLRIEARLFLDTDRLRIAYRATSTAAGPLFLFNVPHGQFDAGVFPLDRGGYVEIGGEAVVVSRKLFPVPPMTLVESPNIPFVTRLLPGATFEEELRLPLPLVPRNPYAEPAPAAGGRTAMRPLVFELGYFVGAPGTEAQARTFPTDAGDRPGFDVFSTDAQRLVRTAMLGSVPVAVEGQG